MTIRRQIVTAAGLVLMVALSGCAGRTSALPVVATSLPPTADTSSPAPSGTPTSTSAASSTPAVDASHTAATGTPTDDGGPIALRDLVMSTDGLSYIRIGEPVPAVPEDEAITGWNENVCGEWEPGISGWDPIFDYDEYGATFSVFSRGGHTVASETSPITLIFVQSADIRTAHDLGVGSSIAELKDRGATVQKKFAFAQPGAAFDPWVIEGSNGELVLWVWEGTDKTYGYSPHTVAFTLVQERGTDPYFPYELDNCS